MSVTDLSDAAQIISYRDAYERVSRYVHSESAAIRELQKAALSGDEVMARAIKNFAKESGWNVTHDIYRAAAAANTSFLTLIDLRNASLSIIAAQRDSREITDEYATKMAMRAREGGNWLETLNSITASAQAVIDGRRLALDRAIQRITEAKGSAADQLLTEMRLTKAWIRVGQQVAATLSTNPLASTAVALNQRLIETKDPYETSAILSEGPSLAMSKGEPDPTPMFRQALGQLDPAVKEAAEGAEEASTFEVLLYQDVRAVQAIIESPYLGSLAASSEAYLDLTQFDYTTGRKIQG